MLLLNTEELVVTTEYLTQWAMSRVNRCRYNRVRVCISTQQFKVNAVYCLN